MVTLPPSSYYYVENKQNPAMNTSPYYHSASSQSLPYWQSGHHETLGDYRNKLKILREMEEIRKRHQEDIAD